MGKIRRFLAVGMCCVASLSESNLVVAGPRVTLSWESDLDSGISGHTVLCGFKSGHYTEEFDVGLDTEVTLLLPDGGPDYYLAVVAYNSAGLRSDPSNEVIYRAPVLPTVQLELPSPDEIVITWDSVPGTGYRVLQSADPGGMNWTPVSPLIVAERLVTRWSVAMDREVAARFFCVEVVPVPEAPALRFEVREGSLKLSWSAVSGASYRILHKPSLDALEWIPVALVAGEGSLLEWSAPVDPGQAGGFYCVEIVSDSTAATFR